MRVRWPGWCKLRPCGDDEQHPKLRHPIHGDREQLQRGRIDPMDIFEDHQHWLPRCHALELRQKRRQCLRLSALWTQLWKVVSVTGWQRQEVGQKRHCLIAVNSRLHDQCFELGELLSGRVATLEAGSPFKLADEWE